MVSNKREAKSKTKCSKIVIDSLIFFNFFFESGDHINQEAMLILHENILQVFADDKPVDIGHFLTFYSYDASNDQFRRKEYALYN